MKKLMVAMLLVVGFSCKDKTVVVPVDPDIAAFTKVLTGTWKVYNTLMFVIVNKPAIQFFYDSIDCSVEKQFDILNQMVITSDLKVINTYACTPSRTTSFEIEKESCCGFIIVNKDDKGNVINIYQIPGYDPSVLTKPTTKGIQFGLAVEVYDPKYIDISQSGSLPGYPTSYEIAIEKQ